MPTKTDSGRKKNTPADGRTPQPSPAQAGHLWLRRLSMGGGTSLESMAATTESPLGTGGIDHMVRRLEASLAQANASPSGVEELYIPPPPTPWPQLGREALKLLADQGASASLTRDQSDALEAIVRLSGRPTLLIQNGTFADPPADWSGKLLPEQDAINTIIQSVGKIVLEGHPSLPYAGTGFLIAPTIIMTNRHVAKAFCRQKSNGSWEIAPGIKASIDFLAEARNPQTRPFALRKVIGVHEAEGVDMALFQIASGRTLPPPLALSKNPALAKRDHEVYTIGYPAYDPRNDDCEQKRIFAGIYQVKRLAPGMVMDADATRQWFSHDCTTLGGNSGSCVVSLQQRVVLGLHFGGTYLAANNAVMLSTLVNDPLLAQPGIQWR